MAFLYLTEQGTVVGKKGHRIIVHKGDVILLDIACHKIEGVMVFGNVQVSTQALALLMQSNIELAFFSRRGRLRGQITAPCTKNIDLRLAQYERHRDRVFRLQWAQAILNAKLHNGRRLIAGFSHNHPDAAFKRSLDELAELKRRIGQQHDLDQLMGIEGRAARVYFGVFGKMLLTNLKFTGRRKRPPPDPVNALLSLSYTMLFNEISSLLDGLGFDPYLGFFHAARYGRASLAADLVEEFRSPVADRFVLRMLNRKSLGKADFTRDPLTGGCHLRKNALKTYFFQWDRWLEGPGDGKRSTAGRSFRRLFRQQAESAMAAVYGKTPYRPYMETP